MDDVISTIFHEVIDNSLTAAILFTMIFFFIRGWIIPAVNYKRLEEIRAREREWYEKEINHVRGIYETRYLELVDRHEKEVKALLARNIRILEEQNKSREAQMKAFLTYLEQYQSAQDDVARLIARFGEEVKT